MIVTYPPGIPVLLMGEQVTQSKVSLSFVTWIPNTRAWFHTWPLFYVKTKTAKACTHYIVRTQILTRPLLAGFGNTRNSSRESIRYECTWQNTCNSSGSRSASTSEIILCVYSCVISIFDLMCICYDCNIKSQYLYIFVYVCILICIYRGSS
jgi:hypothetical protein